MNVVIIMGISLFSVVGKMYAEILVIKNLYSD